MENIDKNINAENADIDNIINKINIYTPENNFLEGNIPPEPRRNPSHIATGTGIANLHPSLESTKAYSTSRFTSEDQERIYGR